MSDTKIRMADMTPRDAAQFIANIAQMTASNSQNWENFKAICESLIISAMDAARSFAQNEQLQPKARFTTQPPCDAERGIAPVEQTHACLYTQVRPCKEIYPDDRDRWCGYCCGTHEAIKLALLGGKLP